MSHHESAPTEASRPRLRRHLPTLLVAALACGVCLLPAVAGGAVLAGVAGWITGTTGLAIVAVILAGAAGLLWLRRTPHHPSHCDCSGCS